MEKKYVYNNAVMLELIVSLIWNITIQLMNWVSKTGNMSERVEKLKV